MSKTPVAPLNLFPDRVAIGRADTSGAVYMTPEFGRALAALLVRVGGERGTSTTDLELAAVQDPGLSLAAAMALRLEALELELAVLRGQLLQPPADDIAVEVPLLFPPTTKPADDIAADLAPWPPARVLDDPAVEVPIPTDWEHPGKIGAAKANSGAFTTVTATTYNKVTITAPAGSATLTLGDGKTFAVSNSLTLAGTDGKTLTLSNSLTFAGTDGKTLTLSNSLTFAGVDGKKLTVNNSLNLAGVDNKTLTVNNTLTFSGTDGAAVNVGAGGTLGPAAYAAANSYVPWGGAGLDIRVGAFGCNGANPQTAKVSGGTLAGVISALVAFGILSS